MSAPRDDEWLSAYLDSGLDDDAAAELEERLVRDSALAARLDAVLDVVVGLRGLDQVAPPEGFTSRLFERVAAQRPHTPVVPLRRRRSWLAISSAAAAVVLVAGVGAAVLLPQSQRLGERSVAEQAATAQGLRTLVESGESLVADTEAPLPDEAAARAYFTSRLERLQHDLDGSATGSEATRREAIMAAALFRMGASPGACLDAVAPGEVDSTVTHVESVVYGGHPAIAYLVLRGDSGEVEALVTDPQTCRVRAVIDL
ncbi:MAG: anti-sigma factor family protein [Egibacteraceae bacterium]